MTLFSNTITTLEHALNYSSTKQKVIAQNISNADTPGYKAKDVNFKAALHNAVGGTMTAKRTDNKHFNFHGTLSSNAVITTTKTTSYQNNQNNVDLDKEMADLAANQIYYNAVTERISGKFQSLQSVIRGGK